MLIAGQPYQVKRSRNGFRLVYEGLRNVAGLFVWADGRERLAVVTCRTIVRFTRWRMRARAVLVEFHSIARNRCIRRWRLQPRIDRIAVNSNLVRLLRARESG